MFYCFNIFVYAAVSRGPHSFTSLDVFCNIKRIGTCLLCCLKRSKIDVGGHIPIVPPRLAPDCLNMSTSKYVCELTIKNGTRSSGICGFKASMEIINN